MKKQSTPIKHRHQHSHSEHQIPTKEKLFPLYRSVTEDDQHNYHTHSSPITRFVRKLLGLKSPSRPKQHHKTHSTTSITKSSVISSVQSVTKPNDLCLTEPKKQTTIKIVTPDIPGTLASSVIDWDRDSLPNSCSIKGDNESTDTCSISSNYSTASGLSTENSSITEDLVSTDKASSAAIHALMSASMLPTKKNLMREDDFDELPPVNLSGRASATTTLMTQSIAAVIRPYIPRRFRIAQNWDLLYSLDQHGASLATLYSCTESFGGPCILIIQDLEEQIFGAYLSNSFQLQMHYYGTGECFLWKSTSQHKQNTPKVKVFPWTGRNDYMMLSNSSFVAIGGGDGKFGLWLDSELHDGHSDICPTFDNEALAFNSKFQCMKVEVWGLCL
ncbi:TLD-domain-containing protein [Choanephora cucurbitarum]|nr:TLD-domain-containing protein [Choanephora cucurbitarum]